MMGVLVVPFDGLTVYAGAVGGLAWVCWVICCTLKRSYCHRDIGERREVVGEREMVEWAGTNSEEGSLERNSSVTFVTA